MACVHIPASRKGGSFRVFVHTIILICLGGALVASCNKQDQQSAGDKEGFPWKEELNISDIPNQPVKGFLNGREVQFAYVNFERWRGSGDNVLNFALSKPEQPCGYLRDFTGFRLISRTKPFSMGTWSKPGFDSAEDSHQAHFFYRADDGTLHASILSWNCFLVLERIEEETVSGRIALCFSDSSKSWLAGNFTAQVCNN